MICSDRIGSVIDLNSDAQRAEAMMNIVPMPAPSQEKVVDLRDLSQDPKRMLKVLWKEFVHHIEDYELEQRDHLNEPEERRHAA
jgi:hypothetical protein